MTRNIPSIQDLLVIITILTIYSTNAISQSNPEHIDVSLKAKMFKNRVEYDSAMFYFLKLNELYKAPGGGKAAIHNRIDIADLLVLQRDLAGALSALKNASAEINDEFADDADLVADFDQVKGSYFLATGEKDSAKSLLKRSIRIRSERHGPNDTMLHYAYNKLGNLFIILSDFDSAFLCHKKALELSLRKNNSHNYLAASSYQNLGIAAHMKGDYQLAEEYYTNSLRLKEQLFSFDDPALAKIYGNLGKFYTDLSKYNIALDYYDKSEKLLASKYNRDNLLFAYLYWNKGNVYTHKGDYVKAADYLSKAETILESSLGPDNQDVLRVLQDLGFAYDKKGDTQLAIKFYMRTAKNRENAGIIKTYRNLGNIYQELNKEDSAKKYYLLSISYSKQIFKGISYDLALCYQYYGEFLAKTGNESNSMWYYDEAVDIFIRLFGEKNKDLSKVYRLQSEYYLSECQYDSALSRIQSSLISLLPEFNDKDPYVNPTINDFVLDIYLQDELQQKATIHFLKFKQNQDLKDLYASLEIINLTIAVTEEIRKTFFEEESQLILNKLARSIIDLGVMVSMELYSVTKNTAYLNSAFQYSEKGQAVILLSALRGLEAQSNTNIPKELQYDENNIAEELATYNNMLFQERQRKYPDKGKIQLWTDKIFNLRLSHDSILASYKKNYPNYFRLKFDYSIISADSVRSYLNEDQAILEYCLTDSLVIGFLLTKDLLYAKQLADKDSLIGNLDSLRQNFLRGDYFNSGRKEFNAITGISSNLYEMLIRPFEEHIKGKRLIIIPDGELGYLSFDLLLKEKPLDTIQAYYNLAWLIKDHPISYSSSATIHFEQTFRAQKKVSTKLLAFAPSYDFYANQRNAEDQDSTLLNLTPMKGTKEEINAISGLFSTKKLFDQQATETYFKEHAGSYGILHLAMHTIIDNHNPLYSKLVFTHQDIETGDDGYLNTYELFNLELPGQLAVLSACNTGGGKLEPGEGIISLARGFFYAGIPSVVMTLWEIEDYSSADLMAMFYKNLKNGYANDIALQKAKIEYLENSSRLQSHPYFWAGYVSIGKISPIKFRPVYKLVFIVLSITFIVILCLLFYLFINRRVFFSKKRY